MEEVNKIMGLPTIAPLEFKEGVYREKDIQIIVTKDGGKWHLSISGDSPIRYSQLKWARYNFIPDNVYMAQIFPPKKEFVNLHQNCFHLYEI